MTQPTDRNELADATSPYLRQHADNPVHWQEWGEDAFAAAREHDVPIFLSIGYSSCHWCHVMAEESFEDDAVAAKLNDHFVPVKVDREERPDVDSLYMQVCQVVRGGGGWPLSVFLTPDRKPFFVGTYFPKRATRGQPGFLELLDDVVENWETEREDLEARADQWMSAARGELESLPDSVSLGDDSPLGEGASAIARTADRTHGGFGRGQKFPQTGRLHVLLRAGDDRSRSVAEQSLDAMADGGLFDHLGGGFHRYCTDRDWTVPHFEKMLYDQGELARLYVDAYRVFGDSRYADVARETLDFVDRELGHPDGGFYATLDARSPRVDDPGGVRGEAAGSSAGDEHGEEQSDGEREEGAFYVWTPAQVERAVTEYADAAPSDAADDTLAAAFRERYGVTQAGNFEGATVLTVSEGVDDIADSLDATEPEVHEWLAAAESRLRAARADRPRPARDDKVLAGWNGLMVRAFAEAGLAFDRAYGERAAAALDFVHDRLWDGSRLSRRTIDGDTAGVGYAEDYAYLAAGALATYESTGDHAHLGFALDLADAMLDACYDADTGAFYEAPESVEDVDVRSQATGGGSTPSPVGVAAETLLALDAFAPDRGYGDAVTAMLERYGGDVESSPARQPELVLAADTRARGHCEVTVAADGIPTEWRAAVGERYLPDRLLSRRPPTDDGLDAWLADLDIEDAPPLWAERACEDGATAYVCRRACSPPLADTAGIEEWLAEFSR
jgi:uncharacterized protein YyaL (SSP411 family)